MFFNTQNTLFTKVAEWLLGIFIVVFPFLLYSGYLFYGTTTRAINFVLVVEIVAIVLAITLFSKKHTLSLIVSPITIALLVLFLTMCLTSMFGVDFVSSFWSKATRMSGLFYFIHLGFFYLVLFSLFLRTEYKTLFLKLFVYSAAVFSVGALLSRDGFGLLFTSKPWTGFTFGNSSFAAMYVYAAFMVGVYLSYTKEIKMRYVLPLLIIVNPYIINRDVWTGAVNVFKNPTAVIGEAQATSVVVLLSLIGLAIGWGISKMRSVRARRFLLIGFFLVGVAGLSWGVVSFVSPNGYLQKEYLQHSTNARPIVWDLSRKAIAERPWFGYGVDNFDRAFESHYDTRLLEDKNGPEPWFDRAHNMIIDQTVENGYVGMIVYLLVFLILVVCAGYVLLCAKEEKHQVLALILMVYFVGHFLELQTAFDTTISYVSLCIMAALAAHLIHESKVFRSIVWRLPFTVSVVFGGAVLMGMSILFVVGTVPIIRAQHANAIIRTIGTSEKRLPHYDALFSSPVDTPTFLWRTAADLQRGVAQKPDILANPQKQAGLLKEVKVFIDIYNTYLVKHPENYRAQINLAGLYIYELLYNENELEKAHAVLDQAIALVSQAPQAYWMKSVTYLYERKFAEARLYAQKAYDLNPDIEQSQKMKEYIEESIKTFPEINFFSFVQM